MPSELQRENYQSLAAQVANRILREIEQKVWVGWLPGERVIAERLQVSRKTVRKSLALLQHRGTIITKHGLGHEIVTKKTASSSESAEMNVGLLAPEAIGQLRPFTALWVDALRVLLIEKNIRLNIFPGYRYFTQHPDKALSRLVSQTPQHCWVLAYSNEQVQNWFQQRGVPCVIAGSSHPGMELPNVDLDYFAVCRHAVGVLLRHGHRRIGMLTKMSQRAGDLESEAGFSAGIRTPSYEDVIPHLMRHDGSVESVSRLLNRMLDVAASPTALIIANPAYYLTTVTLLAQRRLRVPQDISLISRDDDRYLSFVTPSPARYTCNPKTFAKKLMHPLLLQISGERILHHSYRIDSQYVPGESVAQRNQ